MRIAMSQTEYLRIFNLWSHASFQHKPGMNVLQYYDKFEHWCGLQFSSYSSEADHASYSSTSHAWGMTFDVWCTKRFARMCLKYACIHQAYT